MRFFLSLFFIIITSFSAYTQSGELKLLNDINPSNPNSSFWVNTTQSIYPLAVGVPAGFLLTGYIKKDKKIQEQGWHILGALAVNTVLTQALKVGFNRERPFEKYPTIITPYSVDDKGHSFPSGHTSTAFGLATSVSLECKKWYVTVPAFAYASAVGYSRMYLGVHYPTDVLAGATVGIASAYANRWLQKKLFKQRK